MNILQNVVKRRILYHFKGSFYKIPKDICDTFQVTHLLILNLTDLSGARTLFTQDTLGITAYVANRELELTYTTHPEEFKDEFRQKIEQTVPLRLLVDNMKRYVHLLSARTEDIEVLWRALRLYKTQREQWQRKSQLDIKSNYIFGPITMRALSYHDLPEYAIKVRPISSSN